MVKKKEAEGDIEETARAEGSIGTAASASDDDDLKRADGRTIARWKQQVFAELSEGDDQAIAAGLNELAQEEGYDYHCTPATVARWRQTEASSRMNGDIAANGQEDGYAFEVLRQLVRMLGKNCVKKLIDSV